MKNYKVKVIKPFIDSVEKVNRYVNDEFLCTKERYEFLKDKNAVELVYDKLEKNDVINIDEEIKKGNVKGYKEEKVQIIPDIEPKKTATKKTTTKKKSK